MVHLQNKKIYLYSCIVGAGVGFFSSELVSQFIFQGQNIGLQTFSEILSFLIPLIYLGIYTKLLSNRYPHIWDGVGDRIVCISLSLIGYSISWYTITFPTLILKGIVENFSLSSFFWLPVFSVMFSLMFFPIIGVPVLIATILIANYATKGLDNKYKILVAILFIILVFWPSGLVIFFYT